MSAEEQTALFEALELAPDSVSATGPQKVAESARVAQVLLASAESDVSLSWIILMFNLGCGMCQF